MNELEQRLRDALAGRAATTQIDRRPDLPPARRRATAGQRSWPLIVGVAAAVVVITVLGLALLVRSPADEVPASVPSTPSSTSPSTSVDILPEVFPSLPADDPRNADAVAAYSGFVSFETTDAGRALVGRIGTDGRLVDPVTITVFADIDTIPLENPYEDGGEEVVVEGVTYTRYVLGSNPVRIALVHRGDTDVAIVGEDPAAFLVAAGGIPVTDTALRPDGGVSFSLGDLPDGYQTIVPPSTFPTLSPRVDLTVGSDGDDTFGYLTTGRLSDLLLHAGATPFRQVDVNGTTGWANEPSGGGVDLIVWQVAPETWATAMGSGETALELARDAVFVDETTWQSTYDVTPPADPRLTGATPIEPSTTSNLPTAASTTESDPASVEAFCAEYASLQDRQPASYVGSSEHLADIDGLLAVAPDSLTTDLVTFRDYVSSGVIDSDADPDSTNTENWPSDVQSAIASTQAFAAENC